MEKQTMMAVTNDVRYVLLYLKLDKKLKSINEVIRYLLAHQSK